MLLSNKLKTLPMNPYLINWYLNFLSNRKQRLVFHAMVCEWKHVNKGTMQGSMSGPHLFNLFINDFEMHNCPNRSFIKFADDSSLLVPILKNIRDETPRAREQFKDCSNANSMPGNDDKSKELLFVKKGSANAVTAVETINRCSNVKILGLTFEPTSKFKIHVKDKLVKANKCLFVLRNLRKDGY